MAITSSKEAWAPVEGLCGKIPPDLHQILTYLLAASPAPTWGESRLPARKRHSKVLLWCKMTKQIGILNNVNFLVIKAKILFFGHLCAVSFDAIE